MFVKNIIIYNKKGTRLILLLNIVCLFVFNVSFALTGTITSTTYSKSLVCHETTCDPTKAGIINWKPTIASGINAIQIDDMAGLSGHAFGNEMGWINLKPGGGGVTVNQTTGALSGYAWSQTCGWINFAPTNFGISILTETVETAAGSGVGKFSGHAWCGGQYGGWIKFDCSVAANAACVKTNWVKNADRYVAPVPSSGGGGGGGSIVYPTHGTIGTSTSINNLLQNQVGKQNQTGKDNAQVDYSNDFRADIDDSGKINILDFNSLIVHWGKVTVPDLTKPKQERCLTVNVADVNCDGKINVLDFNLVLVYWGKYVGDEGVLLLSKIKN